MAQTDKAYYLNNLELAVLLSLKGMDGLFGIKMEQLQSSGQEAVYRTLFGLEKKEVLSLGENRRIVDGELDELLDVIKGAQTMLFFCSRSSEYPDRCIYLDGKAVLVSVHGTQGEMNRLEGVSMEQFPQKLREIGFFLEEIVSDENLYDDAELAQFHLQEEAIRFFGLDFFSAEEKDWGNATACLSFFSVADRTCIRQYLLIREKLQDYIAVTDAAGSHVYAYSEKRTAEILRCGKDGCYDFG